MSKSNTSELHKRIMYSILIGDEVPVFIINFHKIAIKQTFFYINRTNKHIPYSLHIYRASSSNHPSRMLHFLWHSLPSSVDPQGDSFCHFLLFELTPAKVNTDIKKKNILFCVWMYNVMSFSVINLIFMNAVIYAYFTCICDSLLSSRFLFTHEQYKPDQSYRLLCSVLGLDSSPLHQPLTLFPLSLNSLFL